MARKSGIVLAAGAGLLLALHHANADSEDVARGKYLATIMDCGGCHTNGALMGQPDPKQYLAGSDIGFGIPGVGVFYPPNLTSDAETGLGGWTAEEIVTAVRTGVRPDGRQLVPIMPWPHYAALTDADAAALAAYLKSVPAVRHPVPGPVGPSETPPGPYQGMVMPDGSVAGAP